MKRNLLILSLIIFLNEQKCLAWGSVGHKIIAQIARAELSQDKSNKRSNLKKQLILTAKILYFFS